MPTRERVEAFIAAIERCEFLEVMPEYYAEDATAQENCDPPRVGLAAMMANEKAFLAQARFEGSRAASFAMNGDVVAINWVFDVVIGGHRIHLDEIAYQTWRGEKIVRERYYYDPAQRTPKAA